MMIELWMECDESSDKSDFESHLREKRSDKRFFLICLIVIEKKLIYTYIITVNSIWQDILFIMEWM